MNRILRIGGLAIIGALVILMIVTRSGPLPPGSQMPPLQATGWTNGDPPRDLDGNVVVLEVFATW